MKRITDDLEITGIDISIAKLIATVKMKYLDYEFEAIYERHSSGNKSLIIDQKLGERTHISITQEVEENEEKILKWVNRQFELETNGKQMKRFVKTIDIEEGQILVKKGYNARSEHYTVIVETFIETDDFHVSPSLEFSFDTIEKRNKAFDSFSENDALEAYKSFNDLLNKTIR